MIKSLVCFKVGKILAEFHNILFIPQVIELKGPLL